MWRPRWPRLVLHLLRSARGLARSRRLRGSAPSASSPAARARLPFLNLGRWLLLCAVTTLLRPLGLLTAPLLSAATLSRWPLRRSGATLVFPAGPGALFKFSELLFHEAPALGIPLGLTLVESAIGTAFPSLGVHLAAGRAENAFRKRHRESARIVHFAPVTGSHEDERRKTLLTLIDLAQGSNPSDCWDDGRAEDLLRSQSSPEELRALGATESTIRHVWRSGDVVAPAGRSGTFTVRVEARFEAAHFLREYRGVSEPLHGHSYKVEAELAGKGGGLDHDAIAVDFVSAKKKLDALAKRLDYTCINEVPPFDTINPTAENVAAFFHRELSAAVGDENAVVTAVTIWEGPVNSVRFQP